MACIKSMPDWSNDCKREPCNYVPRYWRDDRMHFTTDIKSYWGWRVTKASASCGRLKIRMSLVSAACQVYAETFSDGLEWARVQRTPSLFPISPRLKRSGIALRNNNIWEKEIKVWLYWSWYTKWVVYFMFNDIFIIFLKVYMDNILALVFYTILQLYAFNIIAFSCTTILSHYQQIQVGSRDLRWF